MVKIGRPKGRSMEAQRQTDPAFSAHIFWKVRAEEFEQAFPTSNDTSLEVEYVRKVLDAIVTATRNVSDHANKHDTVRELSEKYLRNFTLPQSDAYFSALYGAANMAFIAIKQYNTPKDDGFRSPKKTARIPQETPPPVVETVNQYQVLEPNDELTPPTNGDTAPNQSTSREEPKSAKPPPIILVGNKRTHEVMTKITKSTSLPATIISRPDHTKVHIQNAEDAKKISAACKENNVEFYTWSAKKDNPIRVIIKMLPADMPTENIKLALEEKGLTILKVTQMTSRNKERDARTPLPLFLIDLPKEEGSRKIYEVNRLLYYVVKIEAYKSRRQFVQCYRCQRLGHTWQNCNALPRCVFCGADHLHKTCPKKAIPDAPPKCCNCGNAHPANYRGCDIFKVEKERREGRIATNNQQKGRSNFEKTASESRNTRSFPTAKRVDPKVTFAAASNRTQDWPPISPDPPTSRDTNYNNSPPSQPPPAAIGLQDPEFMWYFGLAAGIYDQFRSTANPVDKMFIVLRALSELQAASCQR